MKKATVLSLLGAVAILVVGCRTDSLPTEVEPAIAGPKTEGVTLGKEIIDARCICKVTADTGKIISLPHDCETLEELRERLEQALECTSDGNEE